jgi:vacuolar-type H+-ATPase subunit H
LQSTPNHGFELIHTFLFLFLKKCKTNNTEETRELIKKAEKDYKKQMDVSIKKHRKEMTKKIKNIRSNKSL